MIKNILILIVFIAAIFLINNHYKRSVLDFKENKITLMVKEKTVAFPYTLSISKNITFSNVNITQNKLVCPKGNSAYYEVATTESLYEFSQQTEQVVQTLFDAKKLNIICSINGIRAIQVVLKNDKVINLFIDDNDMKKLKIFYGLSTETFAQTVERLQGLEVKMLEKGVLVKLLEPMTKWSVKHNDFDGIIQSSDH